MRKKIIPVVCIIAVSVLAIILICREYVYRPKEEKNTSTLVIPQVKKENEITQNDMSSIAEENAMVSLIPLQSDETLISIVTQDFDGDGLDDQVNAIKTAASPYLMLLVGIYDPKAGVYQRSAVIATEISQVRTFSYTGIDLTGDHRTALVYQGFAENGDSILQAFFITKNRGRVNLTKIADFRGDGTIFIQQVDRYDAYERLKAKDSSFPIWVYSSDTTRENSTDQLQTRYEFDDEKNVYVQKAQIRVRGSALAAKELARIQDGTVKTFAGFLEGLWYKTSSTDKVMCYLFFNYDKNEIIFLRSDAEEVYSWVHSNLRRNGMYIRATNQEVQNLQRSIDIALRSVDEIHIRILDDVRMRISESSIWDGDYKKMTSYVDFAKKNYQASTVADDAKILCDSPMWKSQDGTKVSFTKEGSYTVSGDSFGENGSYAIMELGGNKYIQFRSQSDANYFKGTYLLEKIGNDLRLKSYILSPQGAYEASDLELDFSPYVEKEEDE